MGICYIYAAMPFDFKINKTDDDLIIAADAGFLRLDGAKADIVLGDFDSLGFVPNDEKIIRHPIRKDDTDTLLAVKTGLEYGYNKFVILGGIGGRLEHTVANIQVLSYIKEHGADGCLTGNGESVVLLCNESRKITAAPSSSFSAFAFGGKADGVTLDGLSYPLSDAVLTTAFPLGVSNAFEKNVATVSVKNGKLLVIWSQNAILPDIFEGKI